jgi:hypothetical protein
MKKSELMREAVNYIWDGCGEDAPNNSNQFICLAVMAALRAELGFKVHNHPMLSALEEDIHSKINMYHTFEDYLAALKGIEDIEAVISIAEIQQLRLCLMDEMIAEYEARGE